MPFDILSVSIAFLALFVWVEGGRLHYDRMVAHDRAYDLGTGTYDSFACPQVNQRGWRTTLTRWSFIALWPALLALGVVIAVFDSLHQR